MLDKIGVEERGRRALLSVEWATLVYTLFTCVLILLFWQRMGQPMQLLEGRALVLGGMALLWLFYWLRPNKYLMLLRYVFPLSLLGYWYPDTYEFCQLFPNLYHVFGIFKVAARESVERTVSHGLLCLLPDDSGDGVVSYLCG